MMPLKLHNPLWEVTEWVIEWPLMVFELLRGNFEHSAPILGTANGGELAGPSCFYLEK